jgi:hypothetical protein
VQEMESQHRDDASQASSLNTTKRPVSMRSDRPLSMRSTRSEAKEESRAY